MLLVFLPDLEQPPKYDFTVTANLLEADGSNSYLVDAAGYLRTVQHAIAVEVLPEVINTRADAELRKVVYNKMARIERIAI
jgi:hypothetical protein